MKNLRKMLKEKQGITLIALVVTIVVLLILAGVSINVLFGQNGLISKAKEAKKAYKEGEQNDIKGLQDILDSANAALGVIDVRFIDKFQVGGTKLEPGVKYDNLVLTFQVDKLAELTEATITMNGGEKLGQVVGAPQGKEAECVSFKVSGNGKYELKVSGKLKGSTVEGRASVEVTEVTYTFDASKSKDLTSIGWTKMQEIANEIAKDSSITNRTQTVTKLGETINVGDTMTVYYNNDPKTVRILGFNHDDLADGTGKAGISFEFKDILMKARMNATQTNVNGWAETEMRNTTLSKVVLKADSQGTINIGIKPVKKTYIKTYNDPKTNNQTSNDKLWLLSCSEVFNNGYAESKFGYAIAKEGEQYMLYSGIKETYNANSANRQKGNSWWLRSPIYNLSAGFSSVYLDGYCNTNIHAIASLGVVPGFAI